MCSQCEELIEEIRETQLEIGELRTDIHALTLYRDRLIRVIKRTRRNLGQVGKRARQAMTAHCPKGKWAYLRGIVEATAPLLKNIMSG